MLIYCVLIALLFSLSAGFGGEIVGIVIVVLLAVVGVATVITYIVR